MSWITATSTSTIPHLHEGPPNLAAGCVCMAEFRRLPSTVQGIKDGYLSSLVIDQPAAVLSRTWRPSGERCLTKRFGFSGLFMDGGSSCSSTSPTWT